MKPFASSARWVVAVFIIIQVWNYTCLVIFRQVEFESRREARAGNQVIRDQVIRRLGNQTFVIQKNMERICLSVILDCGLLITDCGFE
jgi:hypothetical protein